MKASKNKLAGAHKLTGGARERAVSLILNHECGSDKRGFELLSKDDKRLVRRMEREWNADELAHNEMVQQLTRRSL